MMVLPRIRLYLSGPLRLEREGEPLHLPTRKAEALLAYLALHSGAHSREKLAALFWGDFPDPEARRSLRNAMHMLRHELGPDVVAGRETVVLNPGFPLWVDVLAFEAQATEALATEHPDPTAIDLDLNCGELLAELYDDWAVRARERYQRLYLDLLLHLAQTLRAQGEYSRLTEVARRILACDPTEELAHQHLMFGLFMAGDRNAALNQYDRCVQVLREELDVGPAADTVALYRRIRASTPLSQRTGVAESNLPLPLTSFVGREAQVEALARLLVPAPGVVIRPPTRLLTLTGPGGAGKTRLAIEAARGLAGEFRDGVWWIDLAPLREEAQVPRALAKVLGVREAEDAALPDVLAAALGRQQVLLVLDNCEHLVSVCASLAEVLLGRCPQVQILATSREVLGVPGELNWQVPPLALPKGEDEPIPAELVQWEGVRLFVERAQAVRGDFRLTPALGPGANGPVVAELCRRLDGLPLAIELAAAQVRVLTPQEILARLADRFALLMQGSRTVLPRHQTLRATVDWSYELLIEPERLLLRRLAVFAGGWTLEAAEAVVPGENLQPGQVLDLLRRLADKSLLVVESTDAHTRYRLLETLREYAAEKLAEAGETEAVRRRHLAHYLLLAETAEPNLRNKEQLTWLRRLDEEYANLRAALAWALRHDPEPAQHLAGLRLATALVNYWRLRGIFFEGRAWHEEALARAEAAPIAWRARALYSAGYLANWQEEHLVALPLLEQGLAAARSAGDATTLAYIQQELGLLAALRNEPLVAAQLWLACTEHFRATGDRWGLATTLVYQGIAGRESSDYEAARRCAEEAAALMRSLGDRWGLSIALSHLGWIAHKQGDYAAARPLFEYRLAVGRECGFPKHVVLSTLLLGRNALAEKDYPSATSLLKEALVLARRWSTTRDALQGPIEPLALLAAAQGFPRQAVRLLAAAETLLASYTLRYPDDEAAARTALDGLRSELGEPAFAAAWAEGSALDLDEAIEEALEV